MRYHDHRLWRIYENVTAVIGLGAIASVTWVVGESLFPDLMPSWPLIGKASYWFIGSIAWIVKADTIKYSITRDPRDLPFRKWWTFRNLKRHKFIMLRKGSNSSRKEGVITTVCPSCDALHGFEKADKSPRVCSYNGCQEIILAPHR